MKQQVNFVTFATRDLDEARRFYSEALGWEPLLDVVGEVLFFQIGAGQVLGFFDAEKFDRDLGTGEQRSTVSGVTLAHNVGSREEVVAVVSAMASGGGVMLKVPQEGEFGGVFHGLVEDPNGVVWEVAHNPGWAVLPDGSVVFDQDGQE